MPLALARKKLLLPRRGPFAFPGTKPGFNPAHVASLKTQISVVPLGGGLLNLLTGKPGTPNGTGQSARINIGGPQIDFSGGNGEIDFTFPTTAFDPCTYAAIFVLSGSSGNAGIVFGNTTGNSSYAIQIAAANANISLFVGGSVLGGASTFASPPANVPLFVAQSNSGSASNGIFVRLDTGFYKTISGTGLAPTVGSGTFYFGNRALGSRQLFGGLCAGMLSNTLLSMPQLIAWAADPWSYWYPK